MLEYKQIFNSAQIFYRNSNKLIAEGTILYYKKNHTNGEILDNNGLISFDNEYFFHYIGNNTYYVNILPNVVLSYQHIDFSNLVIKPWMAQENITRNVDIYRDNSLSDIDIDIRQLINNLNCLPGIVTISSCSGHKERKAYIGLNILTIYGGEILFKILQDINFKLYNYWNIKFNPYVCFSNILNDLSLNNRISIYLEAKHKGYNDINKFNDALETCFQKGIINKNMDFKMEERII